MSDNLKQAYTLIGGRVTIGTREHRDVLIGTFDVITLDHEDGRTDFTEDEAFNLIGALSVQLLENRRRRYEAGMCTPKAEE